MTTTTAPAFETWTYAGVRFLSFPNGSNVHVIDESGRNYGAWESTDRARAVQQRRDANFPDGLTALRHRVHLSGRIVETA